jgi:hypothetical protein
MSTRYPKQLLARDEETPIPAFHFTARIVIAGQVIVHRIEAPSRARALLQLRGLEKHASFELLEEH